MKTRKKIFYKKKTTTWIILPTYSQNIFVSHFLILNNSKSQAKSFYIFHARNQCILLQENRRIYKRKIMHAKKEKRIFRCMPHAIRIFVYIIPCFLFKMFRRTEYTGQFRKRFPMAQSLLLFPIPFVIGRFGSLFCCFYSQKKNVGPVSDFQL